MLGPKTSRHSERGGALFLALVAVVGVSTMCASMLVLTQRSTRTQQEMVDRLQAFYTAEAGLAEAYFGVRSARSGNLGTAAAPAAFGHGLVSVEATELGGNQVRLRVDASVYGGHAEMGLVVERRQASVPTLGLFSAGDITIGPGCSVAGFDSRLGAPDDQELSVGRVGSNASVTILGTLLRPTTVQGNVTAGPSGKVMVSENAQLLGRAAKAEAELNLPAVEVPVLPSARAIEQTGLSPLIVPPCEYEVPRLSIGEGGRVVVQGPCVLVVGELDISANGVLELDGSGGAVDLYVTGDISTAGGSQWVAGAEDTSAVTMRIAGNQDKPVSLLVDGVFRGTIYAPEADLEIDGALQVLGNLVARGLQLSGGASLLMDRAQLESIRQQALPRIVSWRILDLARPRGPNARDPFARLGLDADLLEPLSESFEDQVLMLTYMDGSILKTYDGFESAFDWSKVDMVLEGKRDGLDLDLTRKMAEETVASTVPKEAPADGALLTAIVGDTSAMTSDEIAAALGSESPLPDDAMREMLSLVPTMASTDVRSVLIQNGPLSTAMLETATASSVLQTGDLEAVLLDNFGLADRVLLAAVGQPMLTSSDLTSVLLQESPLSAPVIAAIVARVPALDPGDLLTLQAAQ